MKTLFFFSSLQASGREEDYDMHIIITIFYSNCWMEESIRSNGIMEKGKDFRKV